MRLQSDDDLYKVKIVYLGPSGWTLPLHFTYPQIGVFAAITAILLITGSLVFSDNWFVGPFIAVALGLSWFIFRFVDADVPVRKVLKAAAADCQRIGPGPEPDETKLPSLTGRNITVTSEI